MSEINAFAIETSCDETAVAAIDDNKKILINEIISQDHEIYGGVVPEIASREHINKLDTLIEFSLTKHGMSLNDFSIISCTAGPGLIGGVIVGTMMAKGIALSLNKPFLAINHLEGHILSPMINNDIEPPFLSLLISGGHCEIVIVHSLGNYTVIGRTLDDSAGETFDKVAQMLGLAYPGGPIIEKLAQSGDENRFKFPKPFHKQNHCNFSFSGLKTAVMRTLLKLDKPNEQTISDICASLQKCISEIFLDRLERSICIYKMSYPNSDNVVITGGVAANQYIRNKLEEYLKQKEMYLITPEKELCTDNAVMIAWAALQRHKHGYTSPINFEPRSSWPLEELKLYN